MDKEILRIQHRLSQYKKMLENGDTDMATGFISAHYVKDTWYLLQQLAVAEAAYIDLAKFIHQEVGK